MQLTLITHYVVNMCLMFNPSETECFLDSKLLFTTAFSQELKLLELTYFDLCVRIFRIFVACAWWSLTEVWKHVTCCMVNIIQRSCDWWSFCLSVYVYITVGLSHCVNLHLTLTEWISWRYLLTTKLVLFWVYDMVVKQLKRWKGMKCMVYKLTVTSVGNQIYHASQWRQLHYLWH